MVDVGEESESSRPFVYDVVGNLVCDGTWFYQYDAFNRLMQVNAMGTLTFDAAGRVASGAPGALSAAYTYDGLGRLITRRWPGGGADPQRSEDYYYDGVRRIQEVGDDPYACLDFYCNGTIDLVDFPTFAVCVGLSTPNQDCPLTIFSCADLDGDGDVDTTDFSSFTTRFGTPVRGVRDYVYGPGYVDEFVAQTGIGCEAVYVLQDANYNAVALLDAEGSVLRQYVYEPYGGLVLEESPFVAPLLLRSRIGHQGLLADRLGAVGDDPAFGLGTDLLYHNRNRAYAPALGRFLQADPNETGIAALDGLAHNGQPVWTIADSLSIEGLYGDGFNLYSRVDGNPIVQIDPSGLFFYGDILGASALSVDLEMYNLDVSAQLVGAIPGIVGMLTARNLMLEELTGMAASSPDLSGIDAALQLYSGYQTVVLATAGIGILKAGSEFASTFGRYSSRLARGSRGTHNIMTARGAQVDRRSQPYDRSPPYPRTTAYEELGHGG